MRYRPIRMEPRQIENKMVVRIAGVCLPVSEGKLDAGVSVGKNGALHHLIQAFSIKPSEIETIQTHPTKPSTLPPMTTSIASTKEESIAQLEALKCRTQVFSDRLCTEDQVGTAAVLYVDGHQTGTIQYHLGPALEHMVFEAELVGLVLAAHLLDQQQGTVYMHIVFNSAILE